MNVVVFGAGSLGSLIGGVLASEHDVTLVGREPHVSTVAVDGLRVSGEFDFTADAAATTTAPAATDLVIVAVKAHDTADAGTVLSECDVDVCLSLQNGMGNEETLAARLDCPVLAGTCTYGARLVEPGHVECTGEGDVALGPRDGGRSELADAVGKAFDAAGIETVVTEDMPRRLWEKLAINAGINATTALARVPNGSLVDGPASEVAAAAARETARVAKLGDADRREGSPNERAVTNGNREQAGADRREGSPDGREITLSEERVVELVERVATDTAANHSSTLQDVEAGRRTEVDAINGYVVDRADRPVPVNETLTALLRAWETERGLR